MDSPRVFGAIYAGDRWTGGSGPGSRPDFCRPLVRWLSRYIRDNGIRSVVDLGCGDFQWMPQVISATGVSYTGLDVYEPLVTSHRAAWPDHRFEVFDVCLAGPAAIPAGDLYWAKDVLQHWPSDTIAGFLDRFFAARPAAHLVVCNCSGQASDVRVLDDRWHFAPLDGHRPPLAAFSPERLFRWGGKDVYRLSPRR
jgi:trans-aconitate methyltransferase